MGRLSTLGLVGLLLLVGCDISSDQAGREGRLPQPPEFRIEPEDQMPTLNTGPTEEEKENPRFPKTGPEIVV